ncbi:hypothetical protein LPJ63_004904, partial [Coemansia sp. RSA 2711]
ILGATLARTHGHALGGARLYRRGLANLAMFAAAKAYAQDPTQQTRVAIVDEAGSHTYAQLLGDARKVRAALGGGNSRGASIAMLMPNNYEYAAVQWGIWAAGGAVVPLSPMHPERELEYFISNSDARQIICHPTLLANLRPVLQRLDCGVELLSSGDIMATAEPDIDDADIDEHQSALFIYTSGTTGRPKGVVHTHATIAAQVAALYQAWRWTADDRLLHMLPLHHVHGIVVALCSALYSGATTEMLPRFDKDRVWSRLIDGPPNISILMGVPTMYARLLQAIGEMSATRKQAAYGAVNRLRLTISGSAALPASSGGFKLSALEIERELLEHPDIVDVAVVGVPSDEWGEAVAAAVVLRPDASLTIAELKPWCYERIARYKAPKLLRTVDTLPRNLMGKLDKKAVKALFI